VPHRHNIQDNWQQVRSVLKHQHPNLTDEDLMYEVGREDELYHRISMRTHLSEEHTKEFIERLHFAL
jgi:hypothetical protein